VGCGGKEGDTEGGGDQSLEVGFLDVNRSVRLKSGEKEKRPSRRPNLNSEVRKAKDPERIGGAAFQQRETFIGEGKGGLFMGIEGVRETGGGQRRGYGETGSQKAAPEVSGSEPGRRLLADGT